MRTEFKDTSEKVIGTIECDNPELLLWIEGQVIGKRVVTDGLDVWVASATVTDDDGTHVMDYEPRREP
ncbi:hypothetical protein [Streptomyces sp. 5-10]|uniref:hypothetical protein n=1 Tax=Streptomyces sp. 5-10 TaxID=878925 RepID=UPI00168BA5A5|nr:hypothetical protein [Streptomyces sp. 5-10]MBD3004577.1 hypothetical protein [Streptomyces sp. 5-10]